jgi:TP901 family phage tail tape measure protein
MPKTVAVTLKINADTSAAISAIGKIGGGLNNMSLRSSTMGKAQSEIEKLKESLQELQAMNGKKLDSRSISDGVTKTREMERALKSLTNTYNSIKSNPDKFQFAPAQTQQAIGDFEARLKKLQTTLHKTGSVDNSEITNLMKSINSFGGFKLQNLNGAEDSLTRIGNVIRQLKRTAKGDVNKELASMSKNLAGAKNTVATLSADFNSAAYNVKGMERAQKQVESLRLSMENFFGIQNSIYMFKRVIRGAFGTIKDLDAAMADTAVVTNFNMGDMWDSLPRYTKMANKLGVTIQDVYKASTLYYQQGLDTDKAMAATQETLKMGRIANISGAEATDMMTAALRGFNMEVNATNAQRVNDVYSKLAAISASDTKELGTAMSKTASIAKSAGMDLETTTALLAQGIETTRESPENIGTALKTIIARFQELKKNPNSISSVGGERLDYNKVDTALKTIGINMIDQKGNFKNTGDIIGEVSKKWNTLSQAQQRYIATTVAGSRQQSRFIAMVSNNARLVELTDAAYNSNGASAEQYAKTQETVATALNRLTNAWNQFLMGIANHAVIKGGITALTTLLDVVNKISGAFGAIPVVGGPLKFLSQLTSGLLLFKGAQKGMEGGIRLLSDFAGERYAKAMGIDRTNDMVTRWFPMRSKTSKEDFLFQNRRAQFNKYSEFDFADSFINDINDKKVGFLQARRWGKNLSRYTKNGNELTLQNLFGNANRKTGLSARYARQLMFSHEATAPELQQSLTKVFGSVRGIGAQKAEEFAEAFVRTMRAHGSTIDSAVKQTIENANINDAAKKNLSKYIDDIAYDIGKTTVSPESVKKLSNSMTKMYHATNVADRIGAIGMSAGSTLDAIGFHKTGSVVGQMGVGVGNLAYMGSSALDLKQLIHGKNIGKGIGKFLGSTGGQASIAVALGLALNEVGKYFGQDHSDIEAGQQILRKYNKELSSLSAQKTRIKSMRDEFAQLSTGISLNGKNLSLSNEEYEKYLKRAKEIAKVNPSLVRGYDKNGNAILDTRNAISKTLGYLDSEIDTTKAKFYNDKNTKKILQGFQQRLDEGGLSKSNFWLANKGLREQSGKFGELDNFSKADQKRLRQLGVTNRTSSEKLANIFTTNPSASKNLSSSGKLLANQLKNQLAVEKTVMAEREQFVAGYASYHLKDAVGSIKNESLLKAVYSKTAKRKDLTQKNLAQYLSKDLAIAQTLSDNVEFAGAMRDVNKAQKDWNTTTDKTSDNLKKYQGRLAESVSTLKELKKEAKTKTEKGFIQSQIDSIEHLKANAVSLEHALNPFADWEAKARGAYDRFKDEIKAGDFYSGVNSLKSITDEMLKKENAGGSGSRTFWSGAKELFTQNYLETHGIAQVRAQTQKLSGLLQPGQQSADSFDKFIRRVGELSKDPTLKSLASKGIKGIREDNFDKLSESTGIEKQALAAMRDNAKQYGYFSYNVNEAAEAIKMASTTIKGKNGQRYYNDQEVKEQYRNAKGSLEGYSTFLKDLEGKGLRAFNLSKASETDIQQFAKDVGGLTRKNKLNAEVLAQQWSKMGYSSDEISEKFGKLNKSLLWTNGKSLEDIVKQTEAKGKIDETSGEGVVAKNTSTIVGQLDAVLGHLSAQNLDKDTTASAIRGVEEATSKALLSNKQLVDPNTSIASALSNNQAALESNKQELAKWNAARNDKSLTAEQQGYAQKIYDSLNRSQAQLQNQQSLLNNLQMLQNSGLSNTAYQGAANLTVNGNISDAQLKALIDDLNSLPAEKQLNILTAITGDPSGFEKLVHQWDSMGDKEEKVKAVKAAFHLQDDKQAERFVKLIDGMDAKTRRKFTAQGVVSVDTSKANGSINSVTNKLGILARLRAMPGVYVRAQGALGTLGAIWSKLKSIAGNWVARLSIFTARAGGGGKGGKSGARGINYKGKSYAFGRGRGGSETALTGELGPEIVWLPSQGKYFITGKNGPELQDLPRDAVVYPHKMSKQIAKKHPKLLNGGHSYAKGKLPKMGNSYASPPSKKAMEKAKKEYDKINGWAHPIKKAKAWLKYQNERAAYNAKYRIYEQQAAAERVAAQKARARAEAARKQAERRRAAQASYKRSMQNKTAARVTARGKSANISSITGMARKPASAPSARPSPVAKATAKITGNVIAKAATKAIKQGVKALQRVIQNPYDVSEDLSDALGDLGGLGGGGGAGGGGGGGGGGGRGGGGGGKGGSDDKDKWKNDVHKYYNILRNIERYEAEQAMSAAKYDRIAKSGDLSLGNTATMKGLYDKQISALNNKKAQREALVRAGDDYYKHLQNRFNNDLKEAGGSGSITDYVTLDTKTGLTQIDWGKISGITKNEVGSVIKDAMGEFESWGKELTGAAQGIEDDTTAIKELQYQLIEASGNLYNMVQNGYLTRQKNMIDNLSDIYEGLNRLSSEMLNSAKESISKSKQSKDNAKAEKSLNDLRARIAYLSQDTGNTHAVELANLQKQLEEGEENYQDSLTNQKLDEIEKSSKIAEEQRKNQLDILKMQLTFMEESGLIWKEIERIVLAGFDNNGVGKENSEMMDYIRYQQEWFKKNYYDRLKLDKDRKETVIRAEVQLSEHQNIDSSARIKRHTPENYMRFASGGLAPYNGPAWLDGKPGAPEMVLNPTDTKNFIQLRDVLANVMTKKSVGGTTNGINNFEVNIKVDKINNDYDVDKLAERVKKNIIQSATQRNAIKL